MSQVTIYLPRDVERLVRREAKKAGKSLSAWIAELARREVKASAWPEGYFEQFSERTAERFEVPADLPVDEPEPLK